MLPAEGRIAVLHPRAGTDLSALPRDRVTVVQPFYPDHAAFAAEGYQTVVALDQLTDPLAAVLVILPRAKAQARALLAAAMGATSGPVIVDGAKTDGVDSILKDMRKRTAVSAPISKAHGKLFWCEANAAAFADWRAPAEQWVEGYRTAPGVFSADGIDPASQLLASALPAKLGRHVADLGAGWGYLAHAVLADAGVESLDLVEADHGALDCARINVTDPRVRFHWADATTWQAPGRIDTVVMNPPFHSGRDTDPDLGRAFIRAAARLLAPSGQLVMVANRHLPYEPTLREAFRQIDEIGGDNRFKLLLAQHPSRAKR